MKEGPGQDAAAGHVGEERCVQHACCYLPGCRGPICCPYARLDAPKVSRGSKT